MRGSPPSRGQAGRGHARDRRTRGRAAAARRRWPTPRPAVRAGARRRDRPPGPGCHERVDPRAPRGHTPSRGGGPLLRGDQRSARLPEGYRHEPPPLCPPADAGAPARVALSVMTCADVEELRDAFVDAELPGPMLLAVARHAGGCAACDDALRELGALREAVAETMRQEASDLDISGLWPRVEHGIARTERRRVWRDRARMVRGWGAVAAMAAGAVLWMRPSAPPPEPAHVIARRPNQAVIERLSTADNSRVSLRRDRKNGTTLIMVNAVGNDIVR